MRYTTILNALIRVSIIPVLVNTGAAGEVHNNTQCMNKSLNNTNIGKHRSSR